MNEVDKNIPNINKSVYKYKSGKITNKDKFSYFFKRIWAYLMDVIIILPVYIGIIMLYSQLFFKSQLDFILNTQMFIVLMIFSIISFFYYSITEYKLEGSIGKKLVNLLYKPNKILRGVWGLYPFGIITYLSITISQNNIIGTTPSMIMIGITIPLIILSYITYQDKNTRELLVIQNNKKRITFTKSVIRNLSKCLTVFLPLILIIDGIFIFFTESNQRLFDKIAKTNVLPGEVFNWKKKQ